MSDKLWDIRITLRTHNFVVHVLKENVAAQISPQIFSTIIEIIQVYLYIKNY